MPEDLGDASIVEYAQTPGERSLAEGRLERAADVKVFLLSVQEFPQEHEYEEQALEPPAELPPSQPESSTTTPKTTPKLSLKFKKDGKDGKAFDFGKSKFSSRHEVVRRGKEVEVKIDSLKLSKDDVLRVLVTRMFQNSRIF